MSGRRQAKRGHFTFGLHGLGRQLAFTQSSVPNSHRLKLPRGRTLVVDDEVRQRLDVGTQLLDRRQAPGAVLVHGADTRVDEVDLAGIVVAPVVQGAGQRVLVGADLHQGIMHLAELGAVDGVRLVVPLVLRVEHLLDVADALADAGGKLLHLLGERGLRLLAVLGGKAHRTSDPGDFVGERGDGAGALRALRPKRLLDRPQPIGEGRINAGNAFAQRSVAQRAFDGREAVVD